MSAADLAPPDPSVPPAAPGPGASAVPAAAVPTAGASTPPGAGPVRLPTVASRPMPRGKRALDVVGSVALLGALAAVTPAVALAIRLTSPGPVFFRQQRVGQGGVPFRMIKFRTMDHDQTHDEARWATPDDPRVTRIGRLLRQTRLDELPQAIHVLRGEMSLVGPRPEQPAIAARLVEAIPAYPERWAVRPGLTGWAQVHHGYDRTLDDVRTKLRYDLEYADRASLAFDLRILARTVRVVLGLHGL